MVCPVPSIVRLPGEVFAIAGRALASVTVPLTLKLMVVATVGEPFADVIAARRLPVPVSVVLVTVMMLEVALRLGAKNIRLPGSINASMTTMNFSDVRALERPVSLEMAERRREQTATAIRRIGKFLPFGSGQDGAFTTSRRLPTACRLLLRQP